MGTLGSFAGSMFATKGRAIAASALLAFAAAALLILTGLAQAQNGTFANNAAISIPGSNTNTSGHAAPYPSTIGVSGMTGNVTDVDVTLAGVTHTNPDDIDVLLVGPAGQNVRLMSDTGGTGDIANVNLTLDDEAASGLGDSTQISSGTYKPSNFGSPADTFTGSGASEPTPGYGASLSVFDGTDPNGDWKLYVVDDDSANIGQISNGWSIKVSTNNDPPEITGVIGGTANEGSPASIAVAATDPQNDTLAYSFDCNNDSDYADTGDTAGQSSNEGSCTFDDNGQKTVGVKVSDGKPNGADTDSATVTVNNAAPAAGFDSGGAINEGGEATVTFSNPSDPSTADTNAGFRYEYRCDGSAFPGNPDYDGASTTASNSATCDFAQDGGKEVRARIIDKDDGATSYTTMVTVNNVSPTIGSVASDTTEEEPADEGSPATITVSATDPGDDTLTYSFDCGNDGTYETDSLQGEPNKGSCTFDDEGTGTYTVGVKVADDDEFAIGSTNVYVQNVEPEITLTGDGSANEGQTKTYSFSITDPGDDEQTINAVCGANSEPVANTYAYNETTKEGSFACRFPNGPADAEVSVDTDDGDGGEDVESKSVEVANVAPTVMVTGDESADEGQTKTYTYEITDDGVNDTIEDVKESCGANAEYEDTVAADSFECKFIDGGENKNSTVSVEATDNDGGKGTGTKSVAVANVKPSISLAGANTANEGETKTYEFTVTDDGAIDTHTIATDCAGPNAEKVPGSRRYDPDTRTGSFRCEFLNGGQGKTSNVTATVTDNDGAQDTDAQSVAVTVDNVNPTISNIEDRAINENADTGEISFAVGDVDGDTLTVTGESSDTDLVPDENIVISETGANRTVTVTPAENENGQATITLTVSDGDGGTASEEFTVTVRPVNEKPTASPVTPAAVNEDGNEVEINLAEAVSDVETGDADLTYDITDPTTEQGTLTQAEENGGPVPGVFIFDPADDYNTGNGTLDLSYTVTDLGDPDDCDDSDPPAQGCDEPETSDPASITIDVNPTNDAPVLSAIADETIGEDGDTGDLAFTATDVDGDAVEVTGASSNTAFVPDDNIVISGSGDDRVVKVTPEANKSGQATITLTATDGNGGSDTEAFELTVSSVNDNPVAKDDPDANDEAAAYQVVEDQTLNVADGANDILANDTDVEDDSLFVADSDPNMDGVQPESGPSHAESFALNADGSFEYVPDNDYNGPDTFTYRADDRKSANNLSGDVAAVRISVAADNDAPEAVNDTGETDEDTPTVIDVLANDTDVDNQPEDLGVVEDSISDPENGSATLITSGVIGQSDTDEITAEDEGKILYAPESNYNNDADSPDTFTYKVSDGQNTNDLSDEATVSVAVNPTNDAPVAVNDGVNTPIPLAEDDSTEIDVLANDTDVDNQPEDLSVVEDSISNPENGSATLTTEGEILYEPDNDYNGSDTFTYKVSDGADESDASATVTLAVAAVNDAPDFTAQGDEEVLEDSENPTDPNSANKHTVPDWISSFKPDATNEDDPDSESDQTVEDYLITDVTNPDLFEEQPDVTNDGTLTYKLAENENGSAEFTVAVKDSGPEDGGNDDTSDPKTFTITVNADNDKPMLTLKNNPDQSVEEDSMGPGDTDARKHTVPGFATGTPGGGTDEDDQNVTFDVSNDNANLFEEQPAIAEDGTLTYTLAGNKNGAATISVIAKDDNDTPTDDSDDASSDPQTFTVTVAPKNDVPEALPVTPAAVNEDTADVEIDLAEAVSDVETGDADLEYDITDPTTGQGTLTQAEENGGPVPGVFIFDPADDYNTGEDGTLDLGYTVTDRGDPDDCGDTDAASNEDGCDGPKSASSTISVDVNPTNDEPSFALPTGNARNQTVDEDSGAQTVEGFATGISKGSNDESGQTLQFAVASGNEVLFETRPEIDPDTGDLTYKPNPKANGAATVAVKLADNGPGGADGQPDADGNDNESDEQTFTITVAPVNQAPEAGDRDDLETDEDGGNVVVDLSELVSDEETDNGDLTYAIAENGGPTSAQGTASVSGSTFTYDPAQYYNTGDGTLEITYKATDRGDPDDCDDTEPANANDGCDGPKSAIGTLTITVNPVNNNPIADDDVAETSEDDPVAIDALDGDKPGPDGATDEANQPLSVDEDALTQPENGSVTLIQNGDDSGKLLYTPDEDYNNETGDPDTFEYSVSDGQGANSLSDAATVSVAVAPVNDAPVANDDGRTIAEDNVLSFNVFNGENPLASDVDVDRNEGDTVRVTRSTQGAHGSVRCNPNGACTYTPNGNYNGSDSFTYTVRDSESEEDTGTISVSITPVNDKPTAVKDTATTDEDTATQPIDVLANDTDADGDALTLVGKTNGARGTVARDGDDLVYTPNGNYNGSDSFTYTVRDDNSGGEVSTGTVEVTVNPVNDPPDAKPDSYNADDDEKLAVGSANGLLANDTDIDTPNNSNAGLAVADGDSSSSNGISPVSGPAKGSLTLAADGSFEYTPNANATGSDTFTYKAKDTANAESQATEVTIQITTVNKKPTANADAYSVLEDGSLEAMPRANGVLGNDADTDGAAADLSVADKDGNSANGIQPESGPSHGTLDLDADGTFIYEPADDYNGSDTFTYKADDGGAKNRLSDTATVTIAVNPDNDAPTADSASRSTDEDGDNVSIDLSSLVSDKETASLSYELVSPPSGATLSGSTLTYDPADNFNTGGGDPVGISYKVTDKGDPNDCGNADDDCDGVESATGAISVTVNPINDGPVANNDGSEEEPLSTDEGSPLDIDVLDNDTDIEDGKPTIKSFAQGDDGAVSENEDGGLTYTPNDEDFSGADSFEYTVEDSEGATDTATVFVEVAGVNDVPVANDDGPLSLEEDGSKVIDVIANDTDKDNPNNSNAGLSVAPASISDAENGSVTLIQNGDDASKLLYTPDEGYNGSDTFTYKATDGTAQSAEAATVTLDVSPVNDAPEAANDSASTDEDEFVAIDVLGNDTDADGDDLRIEGFDSTSAQGGAVEVAIDEEGVHRLRYTPKSNFHGEDTFTYEACDDDGCVEATVTIAVAPVNDAPAAEDFEVATDEDTPKDINVLSRADDVDGDDLAVSIINAPTKGGAIVNEDQSVTYTPDDDYNGSDSITYRVSDGKGGTDQATISITVAPTPDNPTANADEATIQEDTEETIDVLDNDADADGGDLTVEIVSEPGKGAAAVNDDNTVTYTPDANENGPDTFTYKVCESQRCSAAATVSVAITPVNDRPTARDGLASAQEDTPKTINVFEGDEPLASDIEVSRGEEGATLAVVRATNGQHGDVSVGQDGDITYAPDDDYNGDDSFTYTVRDDKGDEATGQISVTVAASGDAPGARPDSASTDEDDPVTINVLANDSDADGGNLEVRIANNPNKGTAMVGQDNRVTYKPNANANGSDSFSYKVCGANERCSGEATVSITITSVNDAPTAENFPDVETPEDTPTDIDVLAEANDADGDELEIFLPTDRRPAHGTVSVVDGKIRYTPNDGYNGEDSFSYRVDDGELQSDLATVTISVAPVNDAPVARPDSSSTSEDVPVTINVLANDTDADGGDDLSIESFTQPDANKGAVSAGPNGTLIFTPAANFNGEATFTYTVTDGTTGETATVTVTVSAVNDRPAAADDSYTTNEDTPLTVNAANGVLANDSDPDTPGLSAVKVSNPANGTVTLNSDGSFVYTPSGQYNGPDSFTYRVNDGSLSSEVAVVSITVSTVNDKPVPTDDAKSTPENTPLVFPASQLAANDKPAPEDATDEQNQALTVTDVAQAQHGAVSLSNGQITFTPDRNYNGEASFRYTVCDNGSPQACAVMEAIVNVTISAVNSAPVAGDISRTTDEDGGPISVNLADHTSDDETADGNLQFEITEGPTAAQGTATLDGSNLTFTPKSNFDGTVNLRYSVTDDGDGEAPAKTTEASLTITVNSVNDAPTAGDVSATTREDTPANINVLAEAADSDGDDLEVIIVSQPEKGSATVNGDGTVRYSPRTNLNGADSFTYKVTDGDFQSEEATAGITITPVNDSPSAADDAARTIINRAVTINVLANDSDPDGDDLSATVVRQPAKGRVVKNSNGTLKYTPPRNFTGNVSFTYRASDGNGGTSVATVRITVARR